MDVLIGKGRIHELCRGGWIDALSRLVGWTR